jgi:predicted Zn-dependent peptidase
MRPRLLLATLCLLLLAGWARAQQPATDPTDRSVRFTDTRLANGLRVIVSEDRSRPVVAVAVTYDVGSRNERPGRTGLAHLFEHMMFEGSQNVPDGQHVARVRGTGGTVNASTNKDRTNYYQQLPAGQLDLALRLEADRMRGLDLRQANLDSQIGTVSEERKQVYDNQPYGGSFRALDALAYDNFAYRHSTIGLDEDLRATTLADVARFFETYYAPNNAVLAIVGDVNTDECLASVRKHFESIPRRLLPPEVDMSEPTQTAERRLTIVDTLARATRLDIAYKVPPSMTPDGDALWVLASLLSDGRSSRLYDSVVREQPLASSVSSRVAESRGPGLLEIECIALPGVSVADLERAVYDVVERVRNGRIEAWEIDTAKTRAFGFFDSTLATALSRATLLSQLAVYYADPGIVNTRYQRFSAVTAADVQRVAKRYLTEQNRTVVITNPAPAATPVVPAAAQKGGL